MPGSFLQKILLKIPLQAYCMCEAKHVCMHEQATLMTYSYTKKLTKNAVNTQIKHFFPSILGVHGDRMSAKHSCSSCAKCQKTNDVRWYHCSKTNQTAMFEFLLRSLPPKMSPFWPGCAFANDAMLGCDDS